MKKLILTLLVSSVCSVTYGQVGNKVIPVTVRDGNDNPVELPYVGERYLLIFYVDPDHGNQNKEFTDYLEDNPIVGGQHLLLRDNKPEGRAVNA